MKLHTLMFCLALFGCTRAPEGKNTASVTRPIVDVERVREALERKLKSELVVGDPGEKIERVLRDERIAFAYDELLSHYAGRIDVPDSTGSIWILVMVDSKRKMS